MKRCPRALKLRSSKERNNNCRRKRQLLFLKCYTYHMEDEVLQKMRPDRATYWPNYFISALIMISGFRFGPLGVVVGLILVIVTELLKKREH